MFCTRFFLCGIIHFNMLTNEHDIVRLLHLLNVVMSPQKTLCNRSILPCVFVNWKENEAWFNVFIYRIFPDDNALLFFNALNSAAYTRVQFMYGFAANNHKRTFLIFD